MRSQRMEGTIVETNLQDQLDSLLAEDPRECEDRARRTFDRIASAHQGAVVLVGAGRLGRKVYAQLKAEGIRPLAFTDNNAALWNTDIEGIPVLSPPQAAAQFGRRAAFVVTIRHSGYAFPESREQFASLGCTTILSYVALFWKYADQFLPHYFVDLPHKILRSAPEVRRAFDVWADDRSRREYVGQLRYRMLLDHDAISSQRVENEYFPEDLLTLSKEEVFADLGAFDGDTVRSLLGHGDFGWIYAFEPDPSNFALLSRYHETLPPEVAARVTLMPMAAGRTNGKLRFQDTGTVEAAVSEGGGLEVDCAALDQLHLPHTPTFIKMDIEGSEIAALDGAAETIRRHAPIVVASVYHRQDDLWRIPLLLRSLSDRYRFFLRAHDLEGWDLVCYAIPDSRLVPGAAPKGK
jgi:FkbM family methyltransferase